MIQVRYAGLEDYDLILRIAPSVCKAQWAQWIDNKEAVVAFLDGEFAGWLQYGRYLGSVPFINEINVFEDKQRQGVGTFLLLFCEDAVRNLGCEKIMLSTDKNNSAQAFYKKFGYKQLGSYDFFGERTDVLLGKKLTAPHCCQQK